MGGGGEKDRQRERNKKEWMRWWGGGGGWAERQLQWGREGVAVGEGLGGLEAWSCQSSRRCTTPLQTMARPPPRGAGPPAARSQENRRGVHRFRLRSRAEGAHAQRRHRTWHGELIRPSQQSAGDDRFHAAEGRAKYAASAAPNLRAIDAVAWPRTELYTRRSTTCASMSRPCTSRARLRADSRSDMPSALLSFGRLGNRFIARERTSDAFAAWPIFISTSLNKIHPFAEDGLT